MAVTINPLAQRDEGTKKVSQRKEPQTVTEISHTEGPTGLAKQQEREVVYQDLTHKGEPGKNAKQQTSTTTRDPMTVALEEQRAKAKKKAASSDDTSADQQPRNARNKARKSG